MNFRKDLVHVSDYKSGYSFGTEILPVVDANGKFISSELRSTCEQTGLIHPTVHMLLFNRHGQLLVQKRGSNKANSPGKLAQSVGGHMGIMQLHREPEIIELDAAVCLLQETFQELGFILQNYKLNARFPYESANGKNREIVFLYTGYYDGKIRPNRSEIEWVGFFHPRAIKALIIKEPELFSKSFREDLERSGII